MNARITDKANNKEFILNRDSTRIGREKDNDIILDDRAVSKYHARILSKKNTHLLHDLNSTNGTKVNDEYIEKHVLEDGDLIEIGILKFSFSKPSGPARTIKPAIAAVVSLGVIAVVWFATSTGGEKESNTENVPEYMALYRSGMKDYVSRDKDITYLKNAIKKWNGALELEPESIKIKESIIIAESELRKKAEELYMAGKRLYDSGNFNQASSVWGKVQGMVESESDLWNKAQERIAGIKDRSR